jgi:lysophospholipase L1-like esterase
MSTFVGTRAIPIAEARERTLLAVGDSHTYGVFFDADDAYPGRLQALLAARAPGRYRIVNLGLPGMNSSEVVARLSEWLERFRPHAVIVCVGVNNIWNRSDADRSGQASGLESWLGRLRVVRLARIAGVHLLPPTPDVPARPELQRVVLGEGRVGVEHRDAATGEVIIRHEGSFFDFRDLEEAQGLLRRDLGSMLELTRAWDSELVLLTYAEFPARGEATLAQENHREVNEVLRRFAEEHGLRLVDAAARLQALIEAGSPATAYFHADEGHPNRRGYREIAQLVADAFEPRASLDD